MAPKQSDKVASASKKVASEKDLTREQARPPRRRRGVAVLSDIANTQSEIIQQEVKSEGNCNQVNYPSSLTINKEEGESSLDSFPDTLDPKNVTVNKLSLKNKNKRKFEEISDNKAKSNKNSIERKNSKENQKEAEKMSRNHYGSYYHGNGGVSHHGGNGGVGLASHHGHSRSGSSMSSKTVESMASHNGHGGGSNSYATSNATTTSSSNNTDRGLHNGSISHNGSSLSLLRSKSLSIASLCNLGNTCFLNSVLYTLRFTPGFLHYLHHLVEELDCKSSAKNCGNKKEQHQSTNKKSRHNSANNQNGTMSEAEYELEMTREAIDQLHRLFQSLCTADELPLLTNSNSKSSSVSNGGGGTSSSSADLVKLGEPIAPSAFINAIGRLNPFFEGNQQQDAHELLVFILNMLQEIKLPGDSGSEMKEDDDVVISKAAKRAHHQLSKSSPSAAVKSEALPKLANFVDSNFVGRSIMQTRCLECEASTYRSETFTNIIIPLTFEDEADADELSGKDLFLKQILMSETLRENNKYWCEECSRLNEAQRSVQFELLPNVMVIQLKRFVHTVTKSTAYTSKINDYIPTPFVMNCFCKTCLPSSNRYHHNGIVKRRNGETGGSAPKHHYRLFAVIMHLGATLASGHYIAYVRASAADSRSDYTACVKAVAKVVAAANNKQSSGNTGSSDVDGKKSSAASRSKNSSSPVQKSAEKEKSKKNKGILKFLKRGSDKNVDKTSSSHQNGCASSNGHVNGFHNDSFDLPDSSPKAGANNNLVHSNSFAGTSSKLHNGGVSPPGVGSSACGGSKCCGIQGSLSAYMDNLSLSSSRTSVASSSTNGVHHQHHHGRQKSLEEPDNNDASGSVASGSSKCHPSSSAAALDPPPADDVWLECDDETIQAISQRQFEELLGSKQGASTPYLLFYQKY